MRWKRGQTQGIEDRRSQGGVFGMGGGFGGGGMPIPIPAGLGGGGLLVVVAIMVLLNLVGGGGGSPGAALDPLGGAAPAEPAGTVDLTNEGDQVEFVGAVLNDVNDLWQDTFERAGEPYERAPLVLFSGATVSGCGQAGASTGPFYCPADRKVYVDLDFFDELHRRFGAPGDFAQAYVIAHEVGHHVQTVTGIAEQVRSAQQDPNRANELSVAMELQADCLAGVWAQSVYEQGDLEPGDIEEAMGAASAVGDDRIQAGAGMTVDPETWTHGSAEQRSQWFNTGFRTGDPAACDTFGG